MALIEEILGRPAMRQALWRWWYPFFTRRVRTQGIDFLNYAFETEPPMGIPLAPADEPFRPNIQLYHHVAAAAGLAGARVLEVSCGHGGGASYLTRTFGPAEYVALDLNPEGIRYCQTRHQVANLRFVQGDAMALPFPDGSFDVVVNVEASHCYPDFRKFMDEAARVLKPGGVAVISTEFKVSGLRDWFCNVQLFDAARLQRVWLDGIGWRLADELDLTLDDTAYIDYERSIHDDAYKLIAHPHIKLDNGEFKWTSINLTFVKD